MTDGQLANYTIQTKCFFFISVDDTKFAAWTLHHSMQQRAVFNPKAFAPVLCQLLLL